MHRLIDIQQNLYLSATGQVCKKGCYLISMLVGFTAANDIITLYDGFSTDDPARLSLKAVVAAAGFLYNPKIPLKFNNGIYHVVGAGTVNVTFQYVTYEDYKRCYLPQT